MSYLQWTAIDSRLSSQWRICVYVLVFIECSIAMYLWGTLLGGFRHASGRPGCTHCRENPSYGLHVGLLIAIRLAAFIVLA